MLCLVCVRFVVLCETYLKQKDELAKAERKEILEYARGRYGNACAHACVLYKCAWLVIH